MDGKARAAKDEQASRQVSFQPLSHEPQPPHDEPDLVPLEQSSPNLKDLLYDSEQLQGEKKLIVLNPRTKMVEQLCLTNYRILILGQEVVSLPYGYIHQIKNNDQFLRVLLKTGITFQLHLDGTSQQLLELLNNIKKCMKLIPFCLSTQAEQQVPTIYDSYAQIQRMSVNSQLYKIFKNTDNKHCQTYPAFFVLYILRHLQLIPKGVEPQNLSEVRKCRYRHRIPVMSYYNEVNQGNGYGVWRSAKRRKELDEHVLKFDVSYLRVIPGNPIVLEIEDSSNTRSSLNFQSLSSLRGMFTQLNRAYVELSDTSTASKSRLSSSEFYKILSKWYEETDKLISGAFSVVELINQGNNVILEQFYAFDRVSQILVLAEVIMDPFFRTFDGLSILIEKQFVAYGHPFEQRSGFNKYEESQSSPIFVQMLDCLHQLIVAYPHYFEYSSAYLAFLGYEVYTTKYKNFINRVTHPEMQARLKKCPQIIWHNSSKRLVYYNYQYNQESKKVKQLKKKPSVKQYLLWTEYFDMIAFMKAEGGPSKGQQDSSLLKLPWNSKKDSNKQ